MPMPKVQNFAQRLMGGFDRFTGGPSMPGLLPEEADAAAQRHKLQMMATLLQATTPSKMPQSGMAALGAGVQDGMAAKDAYGADMLRANLMKRELDQRLQYGAGSSPFGVVNPSDFTPESMATFAQSNNYGDLKPVEKNLFGRYNPRDYTPESLEVFEKSGNPGDLQRIAPYQAQATPGGGINKFDPISGKVTPTEYTPEQGTTEAGARARVTAQNTATGTAQGTAQGALLTRAFNAENISGILDIAEPLIDEATGSGSGATRDKLAAFFGESTEGAQAIAQLLPLQAAIMLNQPRMEGPQSDRDVQLYREAAGQLGDPTVPNATKKAALKTIRRLQDQYKRSADPAAPPSTELPDFSTLSDAELKRLAGE
jgi:hypothetical protein